jgi:hypothetical protein
VRRSQRSIRIGHHPELSHRTPTRMTTIAQVVSGKENVVDAMQRYIGYSFVVSEGRYKIVGVYPYPLHEFGRPFFTSFFKSITGLELAYANLPVFLAVKENSTPLYDNDPNYLDSLLKNGGFFLPPEFCCLTTSTLVIDL